jgi:hypothetical protein
MTEALPNSLLYVKNGKGGAWWPAAKSKNQIHAGWHLLPSKLIRPEDRHGARRSVQRERALCRKARSLSSCPFRDSLATGLSAPMVRVHVSFRASLITFTL